MFTEDQVEVIAQVIAEIRGEYQDAIAEAVAPLRDRILALEAQLSMLTTLIGGNGKSFEASEVIRKIRMGNAE